MGYAGAVTTLPRDFTLLQVTPELETGGAEQTTIDVAQAVIAAGGKALVASRGGRMTARLVAVGEMPKREGDALVPTMKGPIGEYPSGFKFDVFEIELAPYEYVEYKYSMEEGASMLFAWTATGGLRHDMHAERAKGSEIPPAGRQPEEEPVERLAQPMPRAARPGEP